VKLRVLLNNFASMAALRLGLAALTFALFWLLSHRLSTSELGGFSLLMNAFFMVQALPLLGMTMPLIRRIAAQPDRIDLETSNSFFFAFPISAAIGVGLTLCGNWYAAEGLGWPFALLGMSMLPTAWIVVAECALVGRERMHGIARVNLLEALGRLLGAWIVIGYGLGLTGVFGIFAGLRLAAALAYLLDRNLATPQWRLVAGPVILAYLKQVPTYSSIALITAFCARLDIIVVSRLLSLHEAGVYAAAARLSDAALMMPTMAAIVVFPTQSRLFESDPAGFISLLSKAVRLCLICGFAVALLVIALAPFVVHLIYAPNLAASALILQILILGATVMVIDQLLSTTMLVARAQDADLRSMSVGLLVLVPLLFVLTHFFGLFGAAMAAPPSIMLRVLYRLRWAQTTFSSDLIFPAIRIVLVAAVAVGLFFLHFTGSIVADLMIALSCYAVLLCATRAVRVTDWQAVRHLLLQRRGLGA